MRYGLIVLTIISLPCLLSAQYIAGVRLGETKVRSVRQIRGEPIDDGRTVDGGFHYLRYEDYTFYFGSDSVAEFARYFPTAMFQSELEQLVGKPIQESRHPDFSIEAVYSDTIRAVLDRLGRNVLFVEY